MAGDSDTIFALASGVGRAAIAIIRISGRRSGAILVALSGSLPAPRRAALRSLKSGSLEEIDRALVLWFPAPGTQTGEDVAELHIHGGRAVLKAVTAELLRLGGRPAEPGEFSRRAFVNGKLGLLEAEAIADLVDAETEAQRRQALRLMSGAQTGMIDEWAMRLREILAWQEALIDFPDEDLPPETGATMANRLGALRAGIDAGLAGAVSGVRLREGLVVVVTGLPNVGKSSLVNALAKRDIAITSPMPGTTRDALEVTIEIEGVPVTLVDTAGLRESTDPIEAEGVRRALARAESADLVLQIVEATSELAGFGVTRPGRLVIANKSDVAPVPDLLNVSALTGQGLDELRSVLAAQVRALVASGAEPVFTRARHVSALRDAAQALAAADSQVLPELRGEELRIALAALGRITGRVDVEMVLDLVFSQFCIGK
jgi:tRNA modification GTPase